MWKARFLQALRIVLCVLWVLYLLTTKAVIPSAIVEAVEALFKRAIELRAESKLVEPVNTPLFSFRNAVLAQQHQHRRIYRRTRSIKKPPHRDGRI